MKPNEDKALREHVVYLINGGGAHASFDDVIAKVPAKLRGAKAEKLPHTPWMLLEHLRIAQWDILEFSRNKDHESPKWPEGYWPDANAVPRAAEWEKSIKSFRKDLKAMEKLVSDPKIDLFKKIPWGDGQTILREALLVADHNAYHIAQLVDVLRALDAWEE